MLAWPILLIDKKCRKNNIEIYTAKIFLPYLCFGVIYLRVIYEYFANYLNRKYLIYWKLTRNYLPVLLLQQIGVLHNYIFFINIIIAGIYANLLFH